MNKVEVDNEKNEVRIYHRFKVGDKIYIKIAWQLLVSVEYLD